MSIVPRVVRYDGEKKNTEVSEGDDKNMYCELELEIKTRATRSKKLKKDLKKGTAKIKNLTEDKKRIGEKVSVLKEQSLTELSESRSRMKDLETILQSEKMKLKCRESEAKSL